MYSGCEAQYTFLRDKITKRFEADPDDCAVIVHYQIIVSVIDENQNKVAERTCNKQVKISFNGLEPDTDLDDVVDSIIDQSPLLPQSKREELYAAICELQQLYNDYGISDQQKVVPSSPDKPKSITTIAKSGNVKNIAINMSQNDVEQLLNDSVRTLGMGELGDVLRTLKSLVEISEYDRNLALMVNYSPLMNVLSQLMKDMIKKSIPHLLLCMKIFHKMSTFKNFHSIMGKHFIGMIVLGIVASQDSLLAIIRGQLKKEQLDRFIIEQNKTLIHAISILFNLSYNDKTKRKMIEKGIVPTISTVLKRKDPELVTLALRFLRSIASCKIYWDNFDSDTIIESISNDIFKSCKPGGDKENITMIPIYRESLYLLFTFTNYKETIEEMEEQNLFDNMENICQISALREGIINFFYRVLYNNGAIDLFKKDFVFDVLINSSINDCKERITALTILTQLTQDKENANKIANSHFITNSSVKNMFMSTLRTTDNELIAALLKLIRNLADVNPSLVEGFDDKIVEAVALNRTRNENLTNIMSVANRSLIDSSRSKFYISQHSFISVLLEKLQDTRNITQLHLEIIMFVSSLVLFSTPAKELAKNNIVNLVIGIFNINEAEPDIQAQCMFAFYRFILHGETRKSLTAHPEVIEKIIQLSGSSNKVVSEMAGNVLDLLLIFDKGLTDNVKLPRFNAFNEEWLRKMHMLK